MITPEFGIVKCFFVMFETGGLPRKAGNGGSETAKSRD